MFSSHISVFSILSRKLLPIILSVNLIQYSSLDDPQDEEKDEAAAKKEKEDKKRRPKTSDL
jgi:hypothetical protein